MKCRMCFICAQFKKKRGSGGGEGEETQRVVVVVVGEVESMKGY